MSDKIQKDFPESELYDWLNGTGSSVAAGTPTLIAAHGWGIPVNTIANGDRGTMILQGDSGLLAADTSTAFTDGQTLYWDGTKLVTTAQGTPPIGSSVGAKLQATATHTVKLNRRGRIFTKRVTGSAAAGLAIDTGWGVVITGPFSVVSRTSAGVLRTISSITSGTGGNAGKITVTTSAGAADDTHDVIIHEG